MVSQPKHTSLQTILTQLFARIRHFPNTIKSLFLFCTFLIISFCTTNSFAQFTYELDKTTRFEKMGVEEGLSSGWTTCIHQDKYGFIWIGTQFGLNLYDGYEVKVFFADPQNPQSIFNDHIYSIFEEADGTMWFCTKIGISKYNRANQTFSNYIPDTLDLHNARNKIHRIVQDGNQLWVDDLQGLYRFNKESGQFSSFVNENWDTSKGLQNIKSNYMFIDGDEVLWTGTRKNGGVCALSRFNKETETFVHYENDLSDPESFAGKEVESMIEDKEGRIWVATRGGGLLELIDKEKGKFRQYVHDEYDNNSILHNNLYKVFEDSKGKIWVGSKTGFSEFNKNTSKFTNYQFPIQSTYDYTLTNAISDINEDSNGELWLNTWGGIFRFNPSTKVLRHYLYDPENPSSISGNTVRQIINDRNGQTWIATWENGVNRINRFSNAFRKIQKKANVKNSLSGNHISRFFKDSKDYFWIGCYSRGGLNRTKMNKQKVFDNFEHFVIDPDNPQSISANSIWAIYEDKDQILWFGTHNGLNRFDYNTNRFTRFQHDPDDSTTISSNGAESIFEDSHGTFWVGTRTGLNIMDRETGEFIRFLPDDNDTNSISGLDVSVIFEDSYGELWFGGSYLEKLNRKDTSFIHYLPDIHNKSDIYRSWIFNIAEDDSTNLWLSSGRGGLYKMNRKKMTFTSLTVDHGLSSNTIRSIAIDGNGDIWVSGKNGLSRIDLRDSTIRNYDIADGLVNLELNDRSSYQDEDGWLYFGGRSGFTFFHPDSIKQNKLAPPVYITSLTVAGQQKYFDKPLYEMSTIELQYSENDFSFDFVALNYINSQKNQYAYMLEGYDEDWKYVGNKHAANYTNMSPGKYTFRVKGSNNDGYWNEEGASLVVVIHPPIWKTWWAYTIYALLIISILYGIFRFYLRRQRLLHQLDLEQVQSEKLTELDIEKNKFFSNISHEFRTPLTLILGPLERLIGSPKDENQKQELNLVKRNARRLQTLINQLLSLSKLESGKMKLKARPENIVKLCRLFLQSFHSMAEDKGIKLEFESNVEEYIVYIDTLKFEKVANNLLSNAFKFTERGDSIKVSIRSLHTSDFGLRTSHFPLPTSDCLQIKFSDTGIGIQKEELPHVFDRFYQVDEKQMKTNLGTGIGLALTKELIELHHGTITVDSDQGKGSTFTIFLPIGKDHLLEDEIIETSQNGLETDDELLNDDYLFVQDVATKTDLQTEVTNKSNMPLLLIVEDNDDMRAYIKSYLIGSYNIIEAADGKEGVDIAIEQIPDLIVSDLMMPKLDGNEMTIQLKSDERTSHIPIILLTAKASKESKLEGLETGADDFLTKPFDADELLIRIKNLIEQRRKLSILLSQHIGDKSQTHLIQMSSGKMITKLDEQFIEKATAIVQEHMSSPELNVDMFAHEMAMSRMQMHRKLKSLTDNSAGDLIRNIRLKKAAELLKEGELNVTQISYEIGISSLSNFAKLFKEKYGVVPSEYI